MDLFHAKEWRRKLEINLFSSALLKFVFKTRKYYVSESNRLLYDWERGNVNQVLKRYKLEQLGVILIWPAFFMHLPLQLIILYSAILERKKN